MRVRVQVVVMRVVQRLPGNTSNVPAKGKQERINGLKLLWRPNIERDRGGIECVPWLRSAGMWLSKGTA